MPWCCGTSVAQPLVMEKILLLTMVRLTLSPAMARAEKTAPASVNKKFAAGKTQWLRRAPSERTLKRAKVYEVPVGFADGTRVRIFVTGRKTAYTHYEYGNTFGAKS